MTIATINHLIRLFADAFEDLSADVPSGDIERLAMLIHDSMDQGRRVYHTSAHVFAMCEGMNPRRAVDQPERANSAEYSSPRAHLRPG